ncbi:MAG: outer membrane beta-barrel protein [Litorimonas sp.]
MRQSLKLSTTIGMLSAAALLGACSMSQPYGGHASYGVSGPAYSSGFSGSGAVVTGPNERTYYAPRIDAGYTGHATTIGHGASYGSATAHYGGGYGYGPRARVRPASYTYGSLGAVLYDVDQERIGLQGRLGYQISPLLGIEGEGSIGLIDDETDVAGTTTELKTDYQAAAFAKASLPVGPRLSLHARGGYHFLEGSADTTTGGVTTAVDVSEDGVAYGAGAAYALSPRDSIRLDYTNYEQAGANLDSVAIAFQRRF